MQKYLRPRRIFCFVALTLAAAHSAAAGEYMAPLPETNGAVVSVTSNARGSFDRPGSVMFEDTRAYVRAFSRTAGANDGTPFATIRKWGAAKGVGRFKHDNPVFRSAFNCTIKGYSMTLKRLSNGRGNVAMDFTFSPPISDARVLLFDIDEGSRSYPEKFNVTASSPQNKIYSNRDWHTVAQGDLTQAYQRDAAVHLAMPSVYIPRRGNSLVVESRTFKNENRDFTVLQLREPKPIKQLRVVFVGSAVEAHAYVAVHRGPLGKCT